MPVVVQGNFEKQPDETYPISVDFWPWLDSGEEIADVVVTAVVDPKTDDEAAIISIISGAAQIQDGVNVDGDVITNSKVVQKVTLGTTLKTYSIKILATTTDSNDYEADIRMKVKEVK
jgi:hypothetical protein